VGIGCIFLAKNRRLFDLKPATGTISFPSFVDLLNQDFQVPS